MNLDVFDIRFERMTGATAVETEVRAWLSKLSKDLDEASVSGGSVVVEARPRSHQGDALKHHVRIDVTTPEGAITIGGDKLDIRPHEDVYVAIRDAFRQLRRRLA